jgi:hypothetical protein
MGSPDRWPRQCVPRGRRSRAADLGAGSRRGFRRTCGERNAARARRDGRVCARVCKGLWARAMGPQPRFRLGCRRGSGGADRLVGGGHRVPRRARCGRGFACAGVPRDACHRRRTDDHDAAHGEAGRDPAADGHDGRAGSDARRRGGVVGTASRWPARGAARAGVCACGFHAPPRRLGGGGGAAARDAEWDGRLRRVLRGGGVPRRSGGHSDGIRGGVGQRGRVAVPNARRVVTVPGARAGRIRRMRQPS